MKIKTFRGHGDEGIARATQDANAWLATTVVDSIISCQTAMCSIGHVNEIYQSFAIIIFYDEGATNVFGKVKG